MTPTHVALREATAGAHERVDAAFAGFDLADAVDYARFLAAHADVVGPLEAMLDAHGAARIAPDWPERRRGAALAGDLATLDAHPAPASATLAPALARIDDALAAGGDAALAGALYVIEGSRLGGRMLARGVADGLPTAYLAAPQAPGQWRKLLAELDTLPYIDRDIATAIAAADAVFSAFEVAAGGRRERF